MISHKTLLNNNKLAIIAKYIFLGTLAYMPIYVLFSNWVGAEFGLLELTKAIKEPIMLLGLVLILLAESKNLKSIFVKDKWLYTVILAYSTLVLLTVFIFDNNFFAEILGLVYELRFFLFFIYGILIANRFKNKIRNQAVKVVLFVGVCVAFLGIFQVLILPNNALSGVGYSIETGSQQVFYIHDDSKTTERAFSTTKDPNALGAYLGIILILLVVYLKIKKSKIHFLNYIAIVSIIICLYLTYSRSAWVGLICGLIFLSAFLIKNNRGFRQVIKKNTKIIIVFIVSGVILTSGFLFFQPSVYNDVILHNKYNNKVDSNTKRIDQYSEAVKVIKDNLFFGQGVGSAGPVSFKNIPNKPIISENYYLQIVEEYGLFGFFFFGYIVIYLIARFYKQAKNDNYSLVMLTTFIIVLVANLFNHTWVIEAVAYTWWGLAGLFFNNQVVKKNLKEKHQV